MADTAPKQVRDYYKVLLISQSGKGKTYSFRNMNPETFGFVNVENKPLPFKNSFKNHERPEDYVAAYNALVKFAKDPKIEAIGFDSFSAWTDMLLATARANYKGFDIWNFYNGEIARFLTTLKKIQKEVYLTGHYEIIGMEGNMEKRLKVKGKEWEGVCEKEFSLVLFGDNKFEDNGKPDYFFRLVEENTSAKCPPGILGEDVHKIPNDIKSLHEAILEFVK